MTSPEEALFGQEFGIPSELSTRFLGATAFGGESRKASASTVFELLDPEQRQFALSVASGMSETLGVDASHIELVVEESDEHGRRVVVMDASPNGQHVGLYRDILRQRQEDPAWYMIEVGGRQIDPLKGCTQLSYRAMIEAARARGERYLPDSLALNQHNGHVWTATMMTGDPLPESGKITIGSSSGGPKVNFVAHPIDRGGKSFRVRPAVVVGAIDT
jgi:hypothetical protein